MSDGILTPLIQGRDDDGAAAGGNKPCPVCRRDEKVVMVSGVSRSGRGRILLDQGGVAEYQTELAAMLAPPPRPFRMPVSELLIAAAVGGGLTLLALLIVDALRSQGEVSIPSASLEMATRLSIAWFALLIPAVAIVRFIENRYRFQREEPLWYEAVTLWQQAYYCTRDDIVFSPDSGLSPRRPEEARDFWRPRHVEEPSDDVRRDVPAPAGTQLYQVKGTGE